MPEINPNIIYPNGWIVLYKDVELDNTYQHTFFFSSEADREALFTAPNGYPIIANFSDMMYQRVKGESKIRLAIDKMKVDSNLNIYQCNYMRFKNTQYENKWFYAFVTDITYINDNVCELTYELDIMTTFFFDYRLGTSFVEREHSASDSWDDCLVPESIETGDYNFNAEQPLSPAIFYTKLPVGTTNPWTFDLELVLVANDSFLKVDPFNPSPQSVPFQYCSGLPSSAVINHIKFATYDISTQKYNYISNTDLQNFYDTYIKPYVDNGKTDALQGLFIMPSMFLPLLPTAYEDSYEYTARMDLLHYFYDGKTAYEPFNKKLFTFPYKFCYIRDTSGNSGIYKYEFTTHSDDESIPLEQRDAILFAYGCQVSAIPSSMLVPIYYKGAVNIKPDDIDYKTAYNWDEAMTFSSFPQLSLITDAYKQWLAENGTLTVLNGLKGVIGGMGGAAYGTQTNLPSAVGTGLASVGLSVMTTMEKFAQASLQPNQSLTAGTASALTLHEVTDFLMGVKEITPTMARRIDDFFTMYGYACHVCKIPSRKSRRYWTYTKTLGCVINGNVPNNYLKRIAQIFDNGITFWVTSEKNSVGNYYQGAGRINEPTGQFG